jgi:hypothetical protein
MGPRWAEPDGFEPDPAASSSQPAQAAAAARASAVHHQRRRFRRAPGFELQEGIANLPGAAPLTACTGRGPLPSSRIKDDDILSEVSARGTSSFGVHDTEVIDSWNHQPNGQIRA